ncbi:hypothetical protein PoB_000278400 [Plakobranchus ocellatus]|uniref:Uncharacterized protein n=1 Tax=Plakobranchus ocellatus TaxID=259542 RepID=A0AAV3Y1Z6_9GAST|nr:hypothetical protein PoB_000278400 [Plakobranchus ocellatus]
MGGTTLDPKHNVWKRTPTECVDHGRFTGSRHRWNSEASSYADQFDRHLTLGETHVPKYKNHGRRLSCQSLTRSNETPADPMGPGDHHT